MRQILVVGGSKGIGFAAASRFAHAGDTVAIVARNEQEGKEAAARIGARFFQADVSDPEGIQAALDRILRDFGHLDVVVNSAGLSLRRSVTETSLAEWNRVLAVNLTGVYLVCHHLLPHMVSRGSGVIVNVASTAGIQALPERAAYSAAKAGVIMLTRQMAREYAPKGVRINCVTPGATRTGLREAALRPDQTRAGDEKDVAARYPLGRMAHPDEVAAAIEYLVSDRASFCVGVNLIVDGGSTT